MTDFSKKTNLFQVFLDGILFFFSMGKNPIKEYAEKYRTNSDAENIAKDWQNVGNDIRAAYSELTRISC